MTRTENNKLFGRFEPIVLVLIGFALTTVVGNWLTHQYQSRSARDAMAEKTFSEVTELLDTRKYRMERLAWAYRNNLDPLTIQGRWTLYSESLDKWNGSLNKTYSLILQYFGQDLRQTLEHQLQPKFNEMHEDLENARKAATPDSRAVFVKMFFDSMQSFDPAVYNFDYRLIEVLRSR